MGVLINWDLEVRLKVSSSPQIYEISPSVSRRGIGGNTHSSTRLRANREESDITTFFIPGLDVKVSEWTSWSHDSSDELANRPFIGEIE